MKKILPNAVLCDLDGTLALFDREKVNPYERDFSQDTANEAVSTALLAYQWDDDIMAMVILLSGRKEKYRAVTEQWLDDHRIGYEELYMRANDDNRKDVELKEEIYNVHIKDQYRVVAVFDDRLQVCRLWHRLGLPLFRVGDPDANY